MQIWPQCVLSLLSACTFVLTLSAAPASGQEAPPTGTDLVQIQRELEEQSEQLAAMQRALDEEKKKLLAHKRALQETRVLTVQPDRPEIQERMVQPVLLETQGLMVQLALLEIQGLMVQPVLPD